MPKPHFEDQKQPNSSEISLEIFKELMYSESSEMKPSSSIPDIYNYEISEIPVVPPISTDSREGSEFPEPVGVWQQISNHESAELPEDVAEIAVVFKDSIYSQNKSIPDKESIPSYKDEILPEIPLEWNDSVKEIEQIDPFPQHCGTITTPTSTITTTDKTIPTSTNILLTKEVHLDDVNPDKARQQPGESNQTPGESIKS